MDKGKKARERTRAREKVQQTLVLKVEQSSDSKNSDLLQTHLVYLPDRVWNPGYPRVECLLRCSLVRRAIRSIFAVLESDAGVSFRDVLRHRHAWA